MTEQKHKPKRTPDDHAVKIWTWSRVLIVSVLATVYGMGIMYAYLTFNDANALPLFDAPASSSPGLSTAYLSFLLLVPAAIGAISIYSIPAEARTPRRSLMLGLSTTIIFLGTAALAHTGIFLCVLMAAPFVLLPAGLIAVIVGYFSRRNNEKKKRHYAFTGFVMLLPFLMFPVESQIESPVWERTVEDSVVINATPETVWNHIIRMETISEAEQRPSWYHTLGIPRPVRATLDYEGVGGIRQGEFEFGLTFREEITTWEPHHEVAFNVDVLHNNRSTPVLAQVGGTHFDLTAAGYRIERLSETQVRLHLHSSYHLATNFNGYGALWADWIMHDFQQYVLHTVKNRAES
jgi:uncharacterized protein YndB with AHSA1/START domain